MKNEKKKTVKEKKMKNKKGITKTEKRKKKRIIQN